MFAQDSPKAGFQDSLRAKAFWTPKTFISLGTNSNTEPDGWTEPMAPSASAASAFFTTSVALVPSSVLVTTSKAPVTTSVAPATTAWNSFGIP